MTFGLTNAPTSFQALTNDVFKPYLRKFIMFFFDDILIYSPDLQSHLQHLELTLKLLQQHSLFAKLSKCSFGQTQIEYLGHIITGNGVSADPRKIECMINCLAPTTLKDLRGFLGLIGYYRKFIQHYGLISKPLTELLKTNSFQWTSEAQITFEQLKVVVTTTMS
ncbi:uncharacterized protein LOC113351767 [Papaver somniferum]|uniref:uncharacterized protein LOC113351767 n=1 Tax=Papaver somniferum TaxID=3469 RepID=UPI000E700F4A|nr:uncharacterized protein LOC113351767 [Papaver somniferum]